MAETKAKAKIEDPGMEMEKIKLFRDGEKYKDDLFVSVNDMTFQIQRGVEVEVPRCVKEVIDNSEYQDAMTAMAITELESEYEAKAKKYEK